MPGSRGHILFIVLRTEPQGAIRAYGAVIQAILGSLRLGLYHQVEGAGNRVESVEPICKANEVLAVVQEADKSRGGGRSPGAQVRTLRAELVYPVSQNVDGPHRVVAG